MGSIDYKELTEKIKTPFYVFDENGFVENYHASDKAKLLGFPEMPIVVRVTESSGSRGVRVVRPVLTRADAFLHQKPSFIYISMEEMFRTLDEYSELPDTIAMEYMHGCDLLADYGKMLYIAGRRNYNSSMSIAMASVIEKKGGSL